MKFRIIFIRFQFNIVRLNVFQPAAAITRRRTFQFNIVRLNAYPALSKRADAS